VIRSFRDRETERLWNELPNRACPIDVQDRARNKLRQLNNAASLDDLREPPSNRLERLERDRRGQWSIRISRQWRICFIWDEGNAADVEIVDYH
jgi:toxin HigB-1